jgi:molybdopterin-containing oxidoreductase family iron-sulfur binding subunit
MRWGMTIDLDRCNGCEACVVACRAENNVPTVGEEDCAKGRMMSWIRVERYWEGEFPEVKARFMPVLCQQCDEAPCEPVCPVYATYHSADGLNVQVHNRCIGTRFCANACPYTVRAFNWFDYKWDAPLEQQLNPEVTVRERGMMEKCTFCIQRIRGAQINAEDDKRPLKDGEVQPACAQSCPSEAIVFGDLDDPNSRTSRLAGSGRAFRLLEDLGTKPKVVYLKPVDWGVPGSEPQTKGAAE